jgi:ABC-type molybdate transport system substrate-binding protein
MHRIAGHRIMVIRALRTAVFSLTLFGIAGTACAAEPASGDVVEIFSAGSLRGVVSDLSAAASSELHIQLKATFGGSGTLRERVEKGEHPDLLLSADLQSPRRLEALRLTSLPPMAFARNRMCLVSRGDAALTDSSLIDRLLSPALRVKTSTPVADPSGDYAWALFDRIDRMRPGAAARLKSKAQAAMKLAATPANPGQSATAALFAAHQIDVAITYCSASTNLLREIPGLVSLAAPAALEPHPVYGLALVSNKPAAARIALFLLSEKGQAIIARNGLLPLIDTDSKTR